MTAIGLFFLLFGYLLIYSGLKNIAIGEQIRATFSRG